MSRESSLKKRAGSAEFNGSALLNPKPAAEELLLDQSLSPEKLKIISGAEDLHEVTSLEMCVDTREETLDNFGIYLPKLTQLKMNNSLLSSVRDLGTSLSLLQVLCVARCGLTDLEGISALSSLKELYAAFNSVSDLSPVSLLEDLELLDLEENEVEDPAQLWYLGRCVKLRTLSLEGNPVCTRRAPGASEDSGSSFRAAVRELIPQLIFLDDVPVEEDTAPRCRASLQDWTLLRESIRDASLTDADRQQRLETDSAALEVFQKQRPGDLRVSSTSLSRPLTSCSGSRPASTRSDIAVLNHEASDLTNGVGRVLCGNPLQAARARRQKIKLQNSVSQTRPSTRSSFTPEHTLELEESSSREHRDVFTQLRSWRIEHNKRLLVIEEQQSQVMKIHHSDDDDDEDDDEGSHSQSFSSDDITRDTSSPDWSVQCPSTETLRLSSSSGCSMSPSPPPRAAAAPPAGRRITQIRSRRLRAHKARASEETHGTESIMTVRSQTACPQIIHKPHRPSSSPLRAQWSEASEDPQHSDTQHKPVIVSEKLTPRRPQTARAALQRLLK
ncbi:leucine-rich repeat-containing protein 56 [Carassius auratus]|uniref:Leucine-rich repeat-containing protein 56-like n=1 Tax=Carassius auratus TaxID=7957 RepID=A0A6P6MGA1_CARAU|nr:leucine-rich repeat-containing protein 56-like [Carassius auratus]XP_026095489.1 leucine-rich repeat-containing protein 56-like [Carassius auratus]XP_026095490.1 leucine-rich repeat-containing protein 56-like [Carassius auratus]